MLSTRTWLYYGWFAFVASNAYAVDPPPPTPTELQAQALNAIAQKRRQELFLSISCAQVLDREWTDFSDHDAGTSAAPPEKVRDVADKALRSCIGAKAPAAARTESTVMTLVGSGDVVVYVPQREFAQAEAAASVDASTLRLHLNGVDQGKDAKLVSAESLEAEGLTALHFHVRRGTDNRALWSTIYNSSELTKPVPLRIALGWSSTGAITPSRTFAPPYFIRITDEAAHGIAGGLIALILLGSAWVLFRTDAFRDAHTPQAWADARRLRRQLAIATSVDALRALRTSSPKSMPDVLRQRVLNGYSSNHKYAPASVPDYELAANLALNGGDVDETNLVNTVFGLCIRDPNWKTPRATYSLGRVQLGMWFVFAVTTGVFLFTIFGCLPDLPPSMLALLTVSAATTGASAMADSAAGGRGYEISRGLWRDLTTGFDNKQQLHRFQAIVVNVLLLFVGISNVVSELAIPTFDATWLGFLGLSGVALAAGKQVVEGSDGAGAGIARDIPAQLAPLAAIQAAPAAVTPPTPSV